MLPLPSPQKRDTPSKNSESRRTTSENPVKHDQRRYLPTRHGKSQAYPVLGVHCNGRGLPERETGVRVLFHVRGSQGRPPCAMLPLEMSDYVIQQYTVADMFTDFRINLFLLNFQKRVDRTKRSRQL